MTAISAGRRALKAAEVVAAAAPKTAKTRVKAQAAVASVPDAVAAARPARRARGPRATSPATAAATLATRDPLLDAVRVRVRSELTPERIHEALSTGRRGVRTVAVGGVGAAGAVMGITFLSGNGRRAADGGSDRPVTGGPAVANARPAPTVAVEGRPAPAVEPTRTPSEGAGTNDRAAALARIGASLKLDEQQIAAVAKIANERQVGADTLEIVSSSVQVLGFKDAPSRAQALRVAVGAERTAGEIATIADALDRAKVEPGVRLDAFTAFVTGDYRINGGNNKPLPRVDHSVADIILGLAPLMPDVEASQPKRNVLLRLRLDEV